MISLAGEKFALEDGPDLPGYLVAHVLGLDGDIQGNGRAVGRGDFLMQKRVLGNVKSELLITFGGQGDFPHYWMDIEEPP